MFDSVSVSEGDLVRCKPRDTYKNQKEPLHVDSYLYGRVVSGRPDGDNDMKVTLLDESGNRKNRAHFDADAMEEADHLPRQTSGSDEEIEEKLSEDRSNKDSLAVMQEEQENLVQMQEIQTRTIGDGILRLPVSTVTSAENSHQWVIMVDHPVLNSINFYVDKPVSGWTDEHRIVQLLDGYGVHDANPYKLQSEEMYVRLVGDDPERRQSWNLLTPREKDDHLAMQEVDSEESGSLLSFGW